MSPHQDSINTVASPDQSPKNQTPTNEAQPPAFPHFIIRPMMGSDSSLGTDIGIFQQTEETSLNTTMADDQTYSESEDSGSENSSSSAASIPEHIRHSVTNPPETKNHRPLHQYTAATNKNTR
jgi:hypothetical protein